MEVITELKAEAGKIYNISVLLRNNSIMAGIG
jgi:hypothetical protein